MPAIPSLGGLRGRGNSRAKGVPVRPVPVPLSAYVVDCAVYEDGRRRTAVVVAHRLSTVRHADRIWVLDQGRVVEAGTHDELVASGGVYAGLWAVQTGAGDLPESVGPPRG